MKASWYLAGRRLVALGLLALAAPQPALAAAGPACFAPSALAMRADEKAPRANAPGARVPPPTTAALAGAPVAAALRGSIRRVELPAGQKLVALTFDLCEAGNEIAGYDGALFDYLRAEKVPATLFVGGKWFLTHPERSRQLVADPLFEIANHSWTHWNLGVASGAGMRNQVTWAQAAYERVRADTQALQCSMAHAPARMGLFRFPYGSCSRESLTHVNDNGLLAIQWDVDSGDPDPLLGSGTMSRVVLSQVRPGSIVLMHANGRGFRTAEALRTIIPALRAQGYGFVTVSDLLAAGRPVISDSCYNRTPGDTRIYDERWRAMIERQRAPAPSPAPRAPNP
jgi:peptidoglycan/xylan/chitin deacetylase (PgdA/CDA1 family)